MPKKYTSAAKWFHWLIVLLVGLELLLALIMPGIRHNTTPPFLVSLHFSFGIIIIIVMLLRVLWRLTHRPPTLPRGTNWLEKSAAHLMHFALYILLFIIPFAGWMWANAVGWQVSLFGYPMPQLVPHGWPYTWLAADAHVYLAAAICVLIGLHILAALWHWYMKRDDILERMLPADRLTASALKYFNQFRP